MASRRPLFTRLPGGPPFWLVPAMIVGVSAALAAAGAVAAYVVMTLLDSDEPAASAGGIGAVVFAYALVRVYRETKDVRLDAKRTKAQWKEGRRAE